MGKEVGFLSERAASEALEDYREEVAKLGLISELIFAIDESEGKAYIYNVFRVETDPTKIADHRFAELTGLGAKLAHSLRQRVSISIRYVNPSRVVELEDMLVRRGVEILEEEELPFRLVIVPST